MKEEKSISTSVAEEIDYSGRPFGYQDTNNETALICEPDPVIRQKINSTLKSLDFNIIEATTFKEALKYLSFHTFNVIVVDENFATGTDGINHLLNHLEHLSMSLRRQVFVVLISATFATMDYMHSLNKSVNLIINKDEISEMGLILKKEMEENDYFYHVFKEFNRKYGKI
jgi:response regulator RpfG family c-di-GMP phosphodiesterase